MDSFCQIIKTLNANGKAEWEGCTLSKTLDLNNNDSKDPSVASNLLQLISQLSDEPLPEIMTYFYAETIDHGNLSNGFADVGIDSLQEDSAVPPPEGSNTSINSNCAISISDQNLVSFSIAQSFLSHLSYLLANGNHTLTKFLPLLVLCDGHVNEQRIYFLLMRVVTDNSGQLQVVTETVSCHGPYSALKWDRSPEKPMPPIISVDSNSKQLPNGQSCFVNLVAEYNLFGSSSSLAKDVPPNASQTTIHVKCSEVSEVLSLNPSSITNIEVMVKPVPGKVGSPAFNFYKNLAIIEGLLSAFGQDRVVNWIETDQTKSEDVMSKLKEVVDCFNESKMISSPLHDDIKPDSEDDDNYTYTPRNELDFTEQVWEVLKHVGNQHDLIHGLDFIVKQLKAGLGIRFWLHEDNNTYLANLIRKSYEDKISAPAMQGDLPIQILTEIGMDKLQRDYTEFFFQNSISAGGKLDQIKSWQNSDQNTSKNLLKKFGGLQKLHHITELAVHCRDFMKLSPGKVLKIVRSAAQDYLDFEFDCGKCFTFNVLYAEVKTFLDIEHPSVWKVKIKSSPEQPVWMVSSLCWSREFPFDKLLSVATLDEFSLDQVSLDDTKDEQSSFYYVTQKVRSSHV